MISSIVVAAALLSQTDVSVPRDKLVLLADEAGHYIAIDPSAEQQTPRLFYGNGKTMFEAPLASYSTRPKLELQVNDPRYSTSVTWVEGTAQSVVATCDKRKATFNHVDDAAAGELIAKAEFKRSPMDMLPYALARDDHGSYYYVDHGRFDDNAQKFRVFTGPRGNLKELKLKNIVHDSGGDIFATPTGDLRLVLGSDPASEWVAKKKHTKLVALPIKENWLMIMNELGVYSHVRAGTPCDDI